MIELGQLVLTRRISKDIQTYERFAKHVNSAIGRYIRGDFSDMEHEEDIQMNIEAIKSKEGRILAAYDTCNGKIWIITEWDRSSTTILYPDEY